MNPPHCAVWIEPKYAGAFFVSDEDVKDAIDCARQTLSRTELEK